MKFIRMVMPRNELEQVLALCCSFSIGLIVFRFMHTGYPMFVFLVWNLFLAFLPYAVSNWIEKSLFRKGRLFYLLTAIVWMVFLPNSFYIITDLFHLSENAHMPLWYDLVLIFSFAWTGLLFGIVSVRQMEKIFNSFFINKPDLLFVLPVMFLNGLGVYVGRYLRFNSWDVITSPLQLAEEIIHLFIFPLQNKLDWSMIICFTLLLTVIYTGLKRLSRLF